MEVFGLEVDQGDARPFLCLELLDQLEEVAHDGVVGFCVVAVEPEVVEVGEKCEQLVQESTAAWD